LPAAVTGCFREFRRLRTEPAAAAAGAPPLLTLLTLGEFRVFVADEELPATALIRQKKVMDLLKLLIVHRKTGMVKEVLYDLFWPGYLPKSSRDNLNSIIYRLRRTLGEEHPYVLTDGATLNLNPELCRVDADRFLEALAKAERAYQRRRLSEAAGNIRGGRCAASSHAEARELYYRAKSLYAGNFLQNDLYYDDIRDAREALLNLYLQLLFRLTLMSLEAGENYQALVLAKELVYKDPLCEPAYRLLMIASSLVGNRSDVPRVAERLGERLKRAYGIQPDPRTISLQKLLLEGGKVDENVWREEAMI
jgi:DNA-binding SARP family transcriptional activator